MPAPHIEHYTHITADGQRLQVEIRTPAQRPPRQPTHTAQPTLLCLHGHPGTGQCLAPLTEYFSQTWRTIAPDLRGYGRSRCHAPFTMTTHLADLTSLLDALHVKQCVVLGWSLGGILAIELALQQPQRIAGLALLGTAARPYSQHPSVTTREVLLTAIVGLLSTIWSTCPLLPIWGRRSLFQYLIQQHTATTYQRIGQYGVAAYLQTSQHAKAALNQALRQRYDREADLGRIRCPSIVLYADQDVHICAEASRRTAQQLSKSVMYRYPHTAHLFPWEIPEQVQRDLEPWLYQTQQRFNVGLDN